MCCEWHSYEVHNFRAQIQPGSAMPMAASAGTLAARPFLQRPPLAAPRGPPSTRLHPKIRAVHIPRQTQPRPSPPLWSPPSAGGSRCRRRSSTRWWRSHGCPEAMLLNGRAGTIGGAGPCFPKSGSLGRLRAKIGPNWADVGRPRLGRLRSVSGLIRPSRAILAQVRANFGPTRPNLVGIDRVWAEGVQVSAAFGQIWASSGPHRRLEAIALGAMRGKFMPTSTKSLQFSAGIGPTSSSGFRGRCGPGVPWRGSAQRAMPRCGASLGAAGLGHAFHYPSVYFTLVNRLFGARGVQILGMQADVCCCRANPGRSRPNFVESMPNPDRSRSMSVEVRSNLARFAASLTQIGQRTPADFGPTPTKLGQTLHAFGQSLPVRPKHAKRVPELTWSLQKSAKLGQRGPSTGQACADFGIEFGPMLAKFGPISAKSGQRRPKWTTALARNRPHLGITLTN